MKKIGFMIVYNDIDYVDRAISSVINWVDEMVIVEGAFKITMAQNKPARSDDGTLEILKKYSSNSKITIIHTNKKEHKDHYDIGYQWACERGADWAIMIDSDEIWNRISQVFADNWMHKIDSHIKEMRISEYCFINDFKTYYDGVYPRFFRCEPKAKFVFDNEVQFSEGRGKHGIFNIPDFQVKIFHYGYVRNQKRWKLKQDYMFEKDQNPIIKDYRLEGNTYIIPNDISIHKFQGRHPPIMQTHPFYNLNANEIIYGLDKNSKKPKDVIDKVLVVTVTYNNPVLLQHTLESYEKYDPGYPCDFLVVNHGGKKYEHKFQEILAPNNRVEVSFDLAWKKYPNYKYYFFVHDDCCANKDNWLKVFIDRMKSNYFEKIISGTHLSKLPIGRVGVTTQFWRNYDSVLGPENNRVQCKFLEESLKILYPNNIPLIFKYSDNDRVLVSNECLKATNGVFNLGKLKDIQKNDPQKFSQICQVLHKTLLYPDEGVQPKNLYPPGETWCKLLLLSEFMTSIETLINEYRVVGLEGDGYLESVHGYDQLWGHQYIHHYGSPNFKQAIARIMNSDIDEVSKNFNNKIFLIKCDQIVQKYFNEA